MPATFITRQYNHSARKFLAQNVNLATLKVMLLDPTAAFVATNTTLVEVAGAANAKQISGNGWAVGGQLFANVAVTTTTTDDATLAGDDIRVRAVGGNIGPASAFVLYDDTDVNDAPLFYVQFSEPVYAGVGTDFLIPGVILKLTYTA
jgi:hypothetical protein